MFEFNDTRAEVLEYAIRFRDETIRIASRERALITLPRDSVTVIIRAGLAEGKQRVVDFGCGRSETPSAAVIAVARQELTPMFDSVDLHSASRLQHDHPTTSAHLVPGVDY